ncbi:hypothetical protein Tco_1305622 [Tanacetum coccineum]
MSPSLKCKDHRSQLQILGDSAAFSSLGAKRHIQLFFSPRLIDITSFINPISKGKTAISILSRLVLAASSYYIWLERNGRLFKKKTSSPDQIVDVIISMVRLKLVTFKFKKMSTRRQTHLDRFCSYCVAAGLRDARLILWFRVLEMPARAARVGGQSSNRPSSITIIWVSGPYLEMAMDLPGPSSRCSRRINQSEYVFSGSQLLPESGGQDGRLRVTTNPSDMSNRLTDFKSGQSGRIQNVQTHRRIEKGI